MDKKGMKIILLPILLATVFVLLISCSTGGSAAKLDEAPGDRTTLSHKGISLKLSYLDERDLFKLYSQRNNPFSYYKTGRLIVIETTIQTDTALHLVLENAQLSTPGGSRGPTSNQEVYEYWFSRLKHNYGTKSRFYTPHKSTTLDPHGAGGSASSMGASIGGINRNQYHNWSLKIVTQIIDDTILPPEFEMTEGAETVGYILFDQVRGEKKVDATFSLPVYDDQGELLHEFEYTFPI